MASATATRNKQAAFWFLDDHAMDKVVVNIGGEVPITGTDLEAAMPLGAVLEFTVRARVVSRKFSVKGLGQVAIMVDAVEYKGETLISKAASKAAEAAKDVTETKRKRKKDADPVWDELERQEGATDALCGKMHRGRAVPCAVLAADCDLEDVSVFEEAVAAASDDGTD